MYVFSRVLVVLCLIISLSSINWTAPKEKKYWGVVGLKNADALQWLKEGNLNSYRTAVIWGKIEKERGVYDFNYNRPGRNGGNEAVLRKAQSMGITPMIILAYGNDALYGKITEEETAQDAYARYAAAVATHYGSDALYEIWNEWNGGMGLGVKWNNPPANDTALYTTLLCKTYHAIKSANPKAKVIAGATAGMDKMWVEGLLEHGGAGCMDGLSIHPYWARKTSPPDNFAPEQAAKAAMERLQDFYDMVRKAHKGKPIPIYITEEGLNTKEGQWSDAQLADYITAFIKEARSASFIAGVWWYSLTDRDGDRYGLIDAKTGEKRPGFNALREAVSYK